MTWLLTCDAHRKALAEIEQTKSDRASAIVATSVIERDLVKAIAARMVDDERETSMLFKHSGPLGPFEAKVHLAYLMGLIDGSLRDDLTCVADIRNRFAHQVEPLHFNSHTIHALCDTFTIVDAPTYPEIPDPTLPIEYRSPARLPADATPRARFIQTTKLFLIALWRINHEKSAGTFADGAWSPAP
ncbi:hypothetical protein EOI86_19085 [Hwanghaeella grinnelliae]|uniref:Uncharacterized protein n=1 Tax=Hwanghaeella grinnelliae TaxID=2500179 RepID=A0A437QKA4_9PROT|nr:MltR family transcriptional regulator [Hwanghaeella grinnelliae]RVU34939.1 hypothetical protein EOI86_19085 [Hwanghaeella grinnelliae]